MKASNANILAWTQIRPGVIENTGLRRGCAGEVHGPAGTPAFLSPPGQSLFICLCICVFVPSKWNRLPADTCRNCGWVLAGISAQSDMPRARRLVPEPHAQHRGPGAGRWFGAFTTTEKAEEKAGLGRSGPVWAGHAGATPPGTSCVLRVRVSRVTEPSAWVFVVCSLGCTPPPQKQTETAPTLPSLCFWRRALVPKFC